MEYNEKILEGWEKVADSKLEGTLTSAERKEFQRMMSAEKMSNCTEFYLGPSEIRYQ